MLGWPAGELVSVQKLHRLRRETVERRLHDDDLHAIELPGGGVGGLVCEAGVLHVPRVDDQAGETLLEEPLEDLADDADEFSAGERDRTRKRWSPAAQPAGAAPERQ